MARFLTGGLLVLALASNSHLRGGEDSSLAILTAHNVVRSSLGISRLNWSPALAQDAASWAEVLIREGTFRHDRDPRHGQNLYEIVGGVPSPWGVVSAWNSEARNYHPETNACSGVCGHYTQLVWRSTTYVGCGSARDGSREVWVCDYSPPGNYVGERPY
jgi:uncharacterized protein YkwD